MKTLFILSSAILLGLAGCATTRYHCPEPEGATCMGPREVYSATETQDQISEKKAARATQTDHRDQPVAPRAVSRGIAVEDGALNFTVIDQSIPVRTPSENTPERMPAKIMRVWLAPWEDANGDLHMAERLFTEIERRRWSVGAQAPQLSPNLELLEPLSSETLPPSAPTDTRIDSHSVPAATSAPANNTRLPGVLPAHDRATAITH
jgi:conjugal transfer pilus assembly protein TraV